MSQTPIIPLGESAAVVLPVGALDSIGLRIGDIVDIALGDRELILRPVQDKARSQRLEEITRDVFEQRRDAYRRLA